jgi:hypothetical protein
MTDLMGVYDAASDHFTIKGIRCTATGCQYHHPDSLAGLIRWGSQMPKPVRIPNTLVQEGRYLPPCPFCGKVTVAVPDGHGPAAGSRTLEYVKCPDSPLVYRLAVKE